MKDNNDDNANKYQEIYSYKIDKFNFVNRQLVKQEVTKPKPALIEKTPEPEPATPDQTMEVPSVNSLATAMKELNKPKA